MEHETLRADGRGTRHAWTIVTAAIVFIASAVGVVWDVINPQAGELDNLPARLLISGLLVAVPAGLLAIHAQLRNESRRTEHRSNTPSGSVGAKQGGRNPVSESDKPLGPARPVKLTREPAPGEEISLNSTRFSVTDG